MVAIDNRQMELCMLLHDTPYKDQSTNPWPGAKPVTLFGAFVERLTSKNMGMMRNVQPAGLSGAPPSSRVSQVAGLKSVE